MFLLGNLERDIYVFIDEMYLSNKSAFLQSAIPIPAHLYHQELMAQSRNLLNSLGTAPYTRAGSQVAGTLHASGAGWPNHPTLQIVHKKQKP